MHENCENLHYKLITLRNNLDKEDANGSGNDGDNFIITHVESDRSTLFREACDNNNKPSYSLSQLNITSPVCDRKNKICHRFVNVIMHRMNRKLNYLQEGLCLNQEKYWKANWKLVFKNVNLEVNLPTQRVQTVS